MNMLEYKKKHQKMTWHDIELQAEARLGYWHPMLLIETNSISNMGCQK